MSLATLSVFFIISIVCISLSFGGEPECSKYDYEEKLLSKIIRMEIRLEQLESQSSTLLRMESRINSLASKFGELELAIRTVSGFGETYTRWGRTVCVGNGTQLVYKGYVGGSDRVYTGAASNYLCLPEEPEWANYDDGKQKNGGLLYGSEYQTSDSTRKVFEGTKVESTYQEDAPCAVCLAPRPTILMIPAKVTCPPGWSMEYSGYLMAGHHGHAAASEYICLDAKPEVVPGGEANTNGKLLYMVEARCGSLKCPPYVDGREITCVVCSK